jgi:AcrR family transcriptional regulator
MGKNAAALKARPASRVRARTKALLLDAALRLFARQGVGATAIHEIAAEAGVANGTFYNYFRTREEVVEAASLRLAELLQDEITAGSAGVTDAAERMAIATRRFVLQAVHDPVWAAALIRVSTSSTEPLRRMAGPVLHDLRLGRRRGRFTYRDETAALDLVTGTVLAGMRSVLEGRAGEEHAPLIAGLVLRGLGLSASEADELVRRPLPLPLTNSGRLSPRSHPAN